MDGVNGFVLQRSPGDYIYFEANQEHLIGQLIKVTQQLLDENGFQDLLVIADLKWDNDYLEEVEDIGTMCDTQRLMRPS